MQMLARNTLRGIALLTSIGGLAACMLGAGSVTGQLTFTWFAWLLTGGGAVLVTTSVMAATGSDLAVSFFAGATLAMLPIELLLVWACRMHPIELRWLADRDQAFILSRILDFADAHQALAAASAAAWLLLQAIAVLLGVLHLCCSPGCCRARAKHGALEQDRAGGPYTLLPSSSSGPAETRPLTGFHTPPSHFQSPYTSPARTAPRMPPLLVVEQ